MLCMTFVSSLQPDVGRGFLHISNMFLFFFCVYSQLLILCAIVVQYKVTGLILGLHPANVRRHYKVSPSLIGWAQT